MATVMIVEDDYAISIVLTAYLEKAGYECVVFTNGEEALTRFIAVNPALILLDVMLPGMDGWEVLHEVRRKRACPVIMLTAKGELSERLLGLDSGADDYIAKPFEPAEVVSRVQAVLRRSAQVYISEAQLYYGGLKIDYSSKSVELNGVGLSITPKDMTLLLFLAQHPNQIFHRDQLIDRVWGMDYEGSDRAVDHAIKRLRQALHHLPPDEGEIRTLRGTGYQFYAKQQH